MDDIKFAMPLRFAVVEKSIDNMFGIPGFRILNPTDSAKLDILNNPNLVDTVGRQYLNKFIGAPVIFYDGDADILLSHYPIEVTKISQALNLTIHTYFNLLWLQGDHSISPGPLGSFIEGGERPGFYMSEKNRLISRSDSGYEARSLTQEIINHANTSFLTYVAATDESMKKNPPVKEAAAFVEGAGGWSIGTNENEKRKYVPERIERAFGLLQLARENTLLPLKIAFYNMILECIYSTDDTSEVSHKVAERAALFIGRNSGERKQIFKDIKTAYGIRSKFLHGQKIKDFSYEQLAGFSVIADELVRKSLTKALDQWKLFNGNNEPLGNLFKELLFPESN